MFRKLVDLLFEYPFGGVELQNMGRIIKFVSREYSDVPQTKSAEELVEWLRAFHMQLAERLHKGEDVLDLIPE